MALFKASFKADVFKIEEVLAIARSKRVDLLPKLSQKNMVEKVDDDFDFMCPICQDVIWDMQECIFCKTLYCLDCASTWQQ